MNIWYKSQSYLCIRFSYARLVHYSFILIYWYILNSCLCFKVHVSKDSTVADHCRTYALNYPQDDDYTTVCNHEHDSKCDRCELLPKLFREVRSVIGSVNCSAEERNEKEYEISHSECRKRWNSQKSWCTGSVNGDGLGNEVPGEKILWKSKRLVRKKEEICFFCPEEGCVRSFQQYSSLEKHMDCGKHRYTVRTLEYSVCP